MADETQKDSADLTFVTFEELNAELNRRAVSYVLVVTLKADEGKREQTLIRSGGSRITCRGLLEDARDLFRVKSEDVKDAT